MRLASAMATTFSGFLLSISVSQSSPGSVRLRVEITSIAPSLSLPPLECGFGVRPSQAGRSRAERKARESGSVATRTLAVIGPIPGIVCNRRAVSSASAARGVVRFGGAAQIGGDGVDARLRVGELPDRQIQRHPGFCGQVRRLGLGDKATHGVDALRHHEAEFAQMRADRVRKPGQPPDKEVPRPMAHQNRLLDIGLDGYEPHRRLHDGRADRLRIGSIRLAPPDEGLDVGRRDQA